MRNLYSSIICILLMSCSNYYKSEVAVDEYHKAKFDSFLAQFAQFDGKQLDKSFFRVRENFPAEIGHPDIDKYYFSFLLPYDDECNCVTKELYYCPCYKIEKNNYYLVSMDVCCDVTKTAGYPYDENTLVTYDKNGKMIDFAMVGIGSDLESCKIEPSSKENEIVYTQYCFKDIESAYDGDCDISVYKVTVDDNGKIDKQLLREEKNVKVASLDI